MVPWGHRFPTSTPSRIADCSGLPPMRGLKGLRISFGSFPFRRTQFTCFQASNQQIQVIFSDFVWNRQCGPTRADCEINGDNGVIYGTLINGPKYMGFTKVISPLWSFFTLLISGRGRSW